MSQTLLISPHRRSGWRAFTDGWKPSSPGNPKASKNLTVAVVDVTDPDNPVFTHWTRPIRRLREVQGWPVGRIQIDTQDEQYQKVSVEVLPAEPGDEALLNDPRLLAVAEELPDRGIYNRPRGFAARILIIPYTEE